MPGKIRVERDGHAAHVVFDHPERRNAVTTAMWREIPGICRELDEDPGVRVVVLRGEGDLAFVSGADISQFAEPAKDDAGQVRVFRERCHSHQAANVDVLELADFRPCVTQGVDRKAVL